MIRIVARRGWCCWIATPPRRCRRGEVQIRFGVEHGGGCRRARNLPSLPFAGIAGMQLRELGPGDVSLAPAGSRERRQGSAVWCVTTVAFTCRRGRRRKRLRATLY